MDELQAILKRDNDKELKALFAFDRSNTNEEVYVKFQLWARKTQPGYFKVEDADFHRHIDLYNIQTYRGQVDSFADLAFRGAAKTSRTKLLMAFCILNDLDHSRRYIKVLSADLGNAKQIVTDIYNMFVQPRCARMYSEVFQQSEVKREETMGSFTTATGVKLESGSVNMDQRGALQEDARPDWILFEDFENRKTLYSAKTSRFIWNNMEEARTSLAVGGACIYNANYISELGNVHQIVQKAGKRNVVLITSILRKDGTSAWPEQYPLEAIETMRQTDDDFEGERLCQPSASRDILFDRNTLEAMEAKLPVKEVSGFSLFKLYDASHRYASGHDVAGGVGLDSSTSVFIDFNTIPAQVVATFKSNDIKPDIFGDEIARQARMFGESLVAPENNNYGHATIGRLRQIYPTDMIHKTKRAATKVGSPPETTFGWSTNAGTKSTMMFALAKAIEDGHLQLNDASLIAEAKGYSRNDLIDDEEDPRLTTRHFDLLIAAAIAWQMKDYARAKPVVRKADPIWQQKAVVNPAM